MKRDAELKLSVFILAARNLAESVDDSGELFDTILTAIYDAVNWHNQRRIVRFEI